MSTPLDIEVYENNNIRLDVHEFEGHRIFWLQCGVASIALDEDELRDAHELLGAYIESLSNRPGWVLRTLSAVFLLFIVGVFVVAFIV